MGNGPSCGSQDYVNEWRTYYNDHKNDWQRLPENGRMFHGYTTELNKWMFEDCASSQDPSSPLICLAQPGEKNWGCDCGFNQAYYINMNKLEEGAKCQSRPAAGDSWDFYGPQAYNNWVYFYHLGTMARLQDLCGAHADEAWPHFYHLYNNANGQKQVDDFLAKYNDIPPACAQALKTNYLPENQRLYGLVNGWSWDTDGDGTITHPLKNNNWGPYYINFDDIKNNFMRETIQETQFKHPTTAIFGNPLWTPAQRQDAFRQIMGKDWLGNADGSDFIDDWAQSFVNQGAVSPGKSADDYLDPKAHAGTLNWTDDPDYTGQLPYKPPQNLLPHDPFHRVTVNEDEQKWASVCSNIGQKTSILPFVAGGVCGAIAGLFVPGEYARLMAAGTVGSAAYLEAKTIIGFQALVDWSSGAAAEKKHEAALILSLGGPATVWQSIWEIGLVPAQYETAQVYWIGMAAGVAGGYLTLYPVIDPVLNYGGTALTFLSIPFDAISIIADYFSSGCAAHTWNFTKYSCKCENSNNKPALSAAIVQDIYGATGKQSDMRMDCMHAATTTGAWGTNPYAMGECDTTGYMNNPVACLSAGEWAYGFYDQDPKIKELADRMVGEISHCVDPNNPSMLPPLDVDKPCVQAHGKYARAGGITAVVGGAQRPGEVGKCYDYRAPKGQQEAGQFDWSGVTVGSSKNDGFCSIL